MHNIIDYCCFGTDFATLFRFCNSRVSLPDNALIPVLLLVFPLPCCQFTVQQTYAASCYPLGSAIKWVLPTCLANVDANNFLLVHATRYSSMLSHIYPNSMSSCRIFGSCSTYCLVCFVKSWTRPPLCMQKTHLNLLVADSSKKLACSEEMKFSPGLSMLVTCSTRI